MPYTTLSTPELAAYLSGRLAHLRRGGLCRRCALRYIALDDGLPEGSITAVLGEFDAGWASPR